MDRHKDISTLIFAETPEREIVLVLEASKSRPWFWKMPSEKNELLRGTQTFSRGRPGISVYAESPEETAWRGLFEEAGINARPASFRYITDRTMPNRIREGVHRQYLFAVTLDAKPELSKRIVRQDGNEVEIFLPRLFTRERIWKMRHRVLDVHLRMMKKHGLI